MSASGQSDDHRDAESEIGSVSRWIQDVRGGDDEAARKLVEWFWPQLSEVARRGWAGSPKRVQDEDDVLNPTLARFLAKLRENEYPHARHREDLLRLLSRAIKNKTLDVLRDERSEKRGGGKVRGESAFRGDETSRSAGLDAMPDDQESPQAAAIMAEEMERLLSLLDAQEEYRKFELRPIAEARLAGKTIEEIVQELEMPKRTVERRLEMIRRVLNGEQRE